MSAIETIRGYQGELTAIRRDFHEHPEIGMEEVRTADIVAKLLASWGIDVHRGVGKTGVIGVLKRGEGKRIGLRADMDCLPMDEQTNLQAERKREMAAVAVDAGDDIAAGVLIAEAGILERVAKDDYSPDIVQPGARAINLLTASDGNKP